MSYIEDGVVFNCESEELIGIVSLPAEVTSSTGVLVIVGGPQYRVGSHRQFVHLCRDLATRGIPAMRFDYRGMGDATGEQRNFENVDDDIRAAIDCFQRKSTNVERVILWALCDGASAACFYAPLDDRVVGLVLLNPWVRTESSEAKTYLKHYYAKQIFDPAFWKRLFKGRVALTQSIGNFWQSLRRASNNRDVATKNTRQDLPSRMAEGATAADVPLLLLLSGDDYVANEFEEVCGSHEAWSSLMANATVHRIDSADHTFSRPDWRTAVERLTAEWVRDVDESRKAPVRSS